MNKILLNAIKESDHKVSTIVLNNTASDNYMEIILLNDSLQSNEFITKCINGNTDFSKAMTAKFLYKGIAPLDYIPSILDVIDKKHTKDKDISKVKVILVDHDKFGDKAKEYLEKFKDTSKNIDRSFSYDNGSNVYHGSCKLSKNHVVANFYKAIIKDTTFVTVNNLEFKDNFYIYTHIAEDFVFTHENAPVGTLYKLCKLYMTIDIYGKFYYELLSGYDTHTDGEFIDHDLIDISSESVTDVTIDDLGLPYLTKKANMIIEENNNRISNLERLPENDVIIDSIKFDFHNDYGFVIIEMYSGIERYTFTVTLSRLIVFEDIAKTVTNVNLKLGDTIRVIDYPWYDSERFYVKICVHDKNINDRYKKFLYIPNDHDRSLILEDGSVVLEVDDKRDNTVDINASLKDVMIVHVPIYKTNVYSTLYKYYESYIDRVSQRYYYKKDSSIIYNMDVMPYNKYINRNFIVREEESNNVYSITVNDNGSRLFNSTRYCNIANPDYHLIDRYCIKIWVDSIDKGVYYSYKGVDNKPYYYYNDIIKTTNRCDDIDNVIRSIKANLEYPSKEGGIISDKACV